MAQAGISRIGCGSCRYSIIKSFCSLANVSLPPPTPRYHAGLGQQQRRLLSRSSLVRQQFIPTPEEAHESRTHHTQVTGPPDEATIEEDLVAQEDGEAPSTTSQINSALPWYLQQQGGTAPGDSAIGSQLGDRQKLPSIPDDAPPILDPIVNYLFETSGLDDIALVDLRHIDPPPALGANLIMLLGTARSMKHLNVSADRFCRWLRSNYKLRPVADGLLGRNELKIKLRRRAKRAKLAASVGRQLDDTNRDDGITTGWVCVNVGPVPQTEGEEVPTETVIEEEGAGFVGFGVKDLAPRIVVQMFTEEKRAELDLEGLWDHWQGRREARSEKLVEELEGQIMDNAAKTFDQQKPRNTFEDMNPAPSALKNFRPFG